MFHVLRPTVLSGLLLLSSQLKAQDAAFYDCEAGVSAYCDSHSGTLTYWFQTADPFQPYAQTFQYPAPPPGQTSGIVAYYHVCRYPWPDHPGMIWQDGTGAMPVCSYSLDPTVAPPPPPRQPYPPQTHVTNPKCKSGSIIQIDNLVLGEQIRITGSPFYLYYGSDRVMGRLDQRKIKLVLTDSSTAGLSQIHVTIQYAGRIFDRTFAATPNLSYDFIWDGRDASGNTTNGTIEALVTITNIGPRGQNSNSFTIPLGGWMVSNVGLGSWNVNVHHFYDVVGKKLFKGNGEMIQGDAIPYKKGFLFPNADGSEVYIFDWPCCMNQQTASPSLIRNCV